MDPCLRSAAHPTRPCLTSRRCSPDRNTLGWLRGPGRAGGRVIKGPGEVGGASLRGAANQVAESGRPEPSGAANPEAGVGSAKAGTAGRAGSTPRRQGAAEGCAAAGGAHWAAGGAGGFPAFRGRAGVARLSAQELEMELGGEAGRPSPVPFWLEPKHGVTSTAGPCARRSRPPSAFVGRLLDGAQRVEAGAWATSCPVAGPWPTHAFCVES